MLLRLSNLLSPFALFLASCGASTAGDSMPAAPDQKDAFAISAVATMDEPWAMTLLPGGKSALITEKRGKLWLVDVQNGGKTEVLGAPKVDYGGQGGLGDVKLAPQFAAETSAGDGGTIYLTWVEAGPGDTRGAALGRGTLLCETAASCRIEELSVFWHQTPKVTGRGHFSHRIAFSPDGKYLFLTSGERQKFTPAQDLSNNLGKVLRLNLDGTAAAGNPFADKGGPGAQIWSYGHRNLLGLKFDAQGQLWDLEHGPAGGDELNRIEPGKNYGWPLVSDGDNYDGTPIPRNRTRPDLAQPAISWNPVIAPGDFIFYSGRMWPEWKGQALIAALGTEGLVRVRIDGTKGIEEARYPLGQRIREIVEAGDGALLVLEDGKGGRLLRLSKQ